MGTVSGGRKDSCVISENMLGEVYVHVLKVKLVEKALKVRQDGAVGVLAITIA